jgi:hypothetical protein
MVVVHYFSLWGSYIRCPDDNIYIKKTHDTGGKYHEIFDLIFLYFAGMVYHRVDPLDECIVSANHVAKNKK